MMFQNSSAVDTGGIDVSALIQASSILMAMESDNSLQFFSHPDPVMLSDFSQNHFEDFEKSFFGESSLIDSVGCAGFSDTGFFRPLGYPDSDQGSSYEKVDDDLAKFESNNGSKLRSMALDEPFYDVVDYDKQAMDSKQIVDPFTPTDDLSRLVSTEKLHQGSGEFSGAFIAADSLNCIPLGQLNQQQSSHDLEVSSSVASVAEKSFYSLLPQFSSKFCRNVSSFQVCTPHASLSLIPEHPESLSNSILPSVVHASTSKVSTSSSSIVDRDTRLSIGTQADGGMAFCQAKNMQSGFKLMPSLGKRVSPGLADQKLTSEADFNANCLRAAWNSNLPYALQSRGLIQRSFSSHSLGQLKAPDPSPTSEGVVYPTTTPPSDSNHMQLSPDQSKNFSTLEAEERIGVSRLRRVHSTGDVQDFDGKETISSSAMNLCESHVKIPERQNKIGRYTVEERQNRIHRYRQKRTERNFHKTIKYACRKTLADSRPRVRGRFARTDEGSELQETNSHADYEEDDEGDGASLNGKENSVLNKKMSCILNMSSKAERHPQQGFWRFPNHTIHTFSLSLN